VTVIEIQAIGSVRVLTLSAGRVNTLDVEVLEALTASIRELQDASTGPLVITGAGRVFSAGVDLNRVVDGGRGYTDRLVPALSNAFDALFGFPWPTVAAINGAAIAGGCVLACACDRRLIAPEAGIGAAEVRVGVSFPVAALEVMRYACGDHAEEVLLGAGTYKGTEAVARGLAHRVVSEDVVEAAVAEAAELGRLPVEAYRDTKTQLRGPAAARIRQGGATDAGVRELWGAPETQQRIAAYVESLKRRD
jgi:enoyl-CoA hydratase